MPNKLSLYGGLIKFFPKALAEVAKTSGFGASRRMIPLGQFEENRSIESYTDAIASHLFGLAKEGEWNNEDALYHRAQIAWNSLASLEKFLAKSKDDQGIFDQSGWDTDNNVLGLPFRIV